MDDLFYEWFSDLLRYVEENHPQAAPYVVKAPFMYEEYFERGMTPQQAFDTEWFNE